MSSDPTKTWSVLDRRRGDLRDIGLHRTPDASWLLVEEGLTLAREREIESLFAQPPTLLRNSQSFPVTSGSDGAMYPQDY